VPKEVLQFTRKLFGNIEIRESYGATEIGGIYSNKTVQAATMVLRFLLFCSWSSS
jgi:acyl-CoA synthetase (AMP-forming)/AMP-acid ligase II